ncbi:aldehyde dehydrogenase family protein [Kitasatospora sp. GP82]|uniref:aldehyde dehydrogenase family protein n=1 Tax=Kitasatospora sp. GP82 TaxID=3035089 RepID=UPI002476CD46|nr:aldehyde dehydrogenase family protein [Kitasatospora sp. GP82]MDH6124458.1 acyl-CoA reductase-like NAD-dependent aldehyde dehydrogenase [Kitasatospora sp. GP82]
MTAPQLKPGTSWDETYARCVRTAPEAFAPDRLLNLVRGEWRAVGTPGEHTTPVDGTRIAGPPRVGIEEAQRAVAFAIEQHTAWGRVPLDERKARVAAAVDGLAEQRDLLALLLVWEIGKPWRLACADADRALDGVRWYLDNIERQLDGPGGVQRGPLPGPVSNIASWNYPMSVQVHAELVQLLAGNAVVAKTPSQGGFHCLTLAHAVMHRAGLPVTLLSGMGGRIADALIRAEGLGALAFVGGRANGRKAATALADLGRRHFLEQEGLNAWGIWDFTDWPTLAAHLRKGFEYAKQRCTAYPRYVVQRTLFPAFLETYLGVLGSLRFGHPLAVAAPEDPLPDLDFGPVIHAAKAAELRAGFDAAVAGRAVPLHRGSLADGHFLAGQSLDAYLAPAAVLDPPANWALHHSEPFGPLDSIVLVDTEAELLAAMNAGNGSLVASLATDDLAFADRIAPDLHAFKIGINRPRSRGDREEVFGGLGASWKGAFVGGDLLVRAVTYGPEGADEKLYGNFPAYSLYPPR